MIDRQFTPLEEQMGTLDELRATLGDDFFTRPARTSAEARVNWQSICCCGHLGRYHSETVGGSYVLPAPGTRVNQGVTYTQVVLLHGCRGALATRGFETDTSATNHETAVITLTVNPTCPCTEFRPVAKVDRPNRYFNQRMPLDLTDITRHPFQVGVKAFAKHLSKRRAALADPSWATAEFDRRFTWLPGARVCGISKCTKTDGVLPMFVHLDRSELRCAEHRP
jgi:hypothetical protein